MKESQKKSLLNLVKKRGVITSKESTLLGVHSQTLTRLVSQGSLERIARGQYSWSEHPITEHQTLAIVARAVPAGVICLLSVLGFHGLGTQLPAEVWLAVDHRAPQPRLYYPPLRLVRFSGQAFTAGIETHILEGQPVRMYSIAKTLADLFKYRNKVGLDVTLEALREAWQERQFTMDELDHYARNCRVQRVMKPYLEALVSGVLQPAAWRIPSLPV
jgi:predicted transcriptional regulator of viral defense system